MPNEAIQYLCLLDCLFRKYRGRVWLNGTRTCMPSRLSTIHRISQERSREDKERFPGSRWRGNQQDRVQESITGAPVPMLTRLAE